MRRLLVVLALALGAAPAFGQPPVSPVPQRPAPGSHMREPEALTEKPSGFRMSNVPAKGGAYRYRLMLVGLATVALTALLVVRYLRKVRPPSS